MNKKQEIEKSAVAQKEEEILSFWQENKIFEKSLENESPNGEFVFYDGPPFATGLPHYGHILAGTIKDIIPRFKTMQGYHVPRRWGWDCHGLPIENLIEKELGLENKKDIEEYGIEKFNDAARNSVLRYESEWKKLVPRSGRFVDMENAYMAMNPEYMESIWWVFGELHKKGLTKEGFKAMHICPRCETTLSNFEVNQGYKDVTDISLTVKFELKDEPGTYMLAWTTTPWTLPGNVALAVGADVEYVKVGYEDQQFILAKELLEEVFEGKEYNILEEMKGSELVGREYTPLFDYYQKSSETENVENGWKIYEADFVTTEDGTGIVHIAPAFGSDDMQLGKDKNLPFVQHVSMSGAFKDSFAKRTDGGDFAGMLVKTKDDLMSTDIEIIKRLAHDGKLFSKKKLTHTYPHCWRCDTPLLNYATTSWYVDVPKIKEQLIESNKKVNWVPDHVGDGRFGKWLEGARDWALSRSRFWGTPIPVWQSEDGSETFVASSVESLLERIETSNSFIGLRHGEAVSNTTGRVNANPDIDNPLTKQGREEVLAAAKKLKNVDMIFVSPFQRTRETADIIQKELGLSKDQIGIDERLAERNPGAKWEGKLWDEVHEAEREKGLGNFWTFKVSDDAETLCDVYKRAADFMFEINEKYTNKNILIVGHGGVLRQMQFICDYQGRLSKLNDLFHSSAVPKNGEPIELRFKPFPHNKSYELDLHRPYIDEAVLVSDNGSELKRIPDVFDVWFDSASMPYGQQHYPFENREEFERSFPAQFIAEGLDQTRGWFYVMTVIGNALFGKTPFENVVVNGLILAEDGKKMSKSLQNYPDPQLLFDTTGADAVRLYMINSPVVRAEEFAFSEKGVREVASKVMGRLRNGMSLYKMYAGEIEHSASTDSGHVLDRWIIARTVELLRDVTKGLENYELDRAARPIFEFVDDFSTWYLRRCRDRFKGEDTEDKKKALATTRYVFETASKIIAPFVPFVADELWQDLRDLDLRLEESVHLVSWPQFNERLIDEDIIRDMGKTRELISKGLQMRADSGMKVRQPLASLAAPISGIPNEYHELILDEMNVKELVDGELALDTELTPELVAEGNMRDLLRQIQSLRKKAGLDAHENIKLSVQTSEEGKVLIEKFADEIKKTAGVKDFNFTHNDSDEIKVGKLTFVVSIEK